MRIDEVTEITDEVVAAFGRLIPQLSTAKVPDRAHLEKLLVSDATTIFLAYDRDEQIVGALALVIFHIPTGTHAWIEDVVVDEAARGQGIGEALTRTALCKAESAGASCVDLTSRAARQAANRLYQRLGFQQRETNLYRYYLTEPT